TDPADYEHQGRGGVVDVGGAQVAAGQDQGAAIADGEAVVAEYWCVIDRVHRERDELRLDVAVIVGDAHRELVGAVEIGVGHVAPGPGRGIDRDAAVGRSSAHREVRGTHAIGRIADGQRAGDWAGVFVAGAAAVAAENGRIVDRAAGHRLG